MTKFLTQMKEIINQLANIKETIVEKDLIEQILNSLLDKMESLSIALIYHFDLPTLNDLIGIFLHDEVKKELRGKKTKNEVFLSSTSSTKLNCISLIRTCVRGLAIKHKGNYNFYKNPNYWMQSCVELLNKINAKHECFKNLVNRIEEGNDKEVDHFHDYNEALNKTNTLATKVL